MIIDLLHIPGFVSKNIYAGANPPGANPPSKIGKNMIFLA
jgi:hypothetical protein